MGLLPNPWVILVTLAVWASTLTGCWFYRGHIDDQATKAKLEAVQLADSQATTNFLRTARAEADAQRSNDERTINELEKALVREKADAADARDTNSRLQHAVEIYANAGSVGSGLSATKAIDVLTERLKAFGVLYSNMAAAGERLNEEADGVNDHLAACEATLGK